MFILSKIKADDIGTARVILVLIAWASSESSDEPARQHSLDIPFSSLAYKKCGKILRLMPKIRPIT